MGFGVAAVGSCVVAQWWGIHVPRRYDGGAARRGGETVASATSEGGDLMSGQVQHGAVEGTSDEALRANIEEVARLQGELVAELVGLGTTMSAAMSALSGFVPCGHAFGVVIEGLAASVSCHDPAHIRELTEAVRARSEHVSDHRGVAQGAPVDVLATLAVAPAGDKAAAMRAQLLVSLQGVAPYAMRAMELGAMSDDVDVALANGLAALGRDDFGAAELHAQLARVGEAARVVLTLGA